MDFQTVQAIAQDNDLGSVDPFNCTEQLTAEHTELNTAQRLEGQVKDCSWPEKIHIRYS